MKTRIFFASMIIAGVSFLGSAQGYKDGIEYYKVDQHENAKELLERNLNNPSTDKSEAYYYLGQIALKQGNTAEAKKYFDQGVAANAQNPYNYVGQGALALRQGGNAKQLFDQARKLSKKDCELEMEIARAYYSVDPVTHAKDIEKCIKNARKWDAKHPSSYIFEADTYADKKEWGTAAGNYELAFTNDPNNVEAYVKYANTYFNVDPSFAISRLEELNGKRPLSALVQRQLAEKYYSDNQGAKAAEKYGEYIKNPNHFAQDEVRYVQLLFFGEKYQESYALATSLINKLPAGDKNIFYMRRMQLYNDIQLNNTERAVADGAAFFALPLPANASYEVRDYTDYAKALQAQGKSEEAIAYYDKAIELNPDNTDLVRSLGDSYADAGDYVKAAGYYQRLVDSKKNASNDLFTLSNYYYGAAVAENEDNPAASAHYAKAEQYAQQVNQLVPNNVQIVNQLARLAKVKEGDTNNGAALDYYRQLEDILNAKTDKSGYERYYRGIYNYMATYYYTKGDKTQAKIYYQKWLDFDPDNEALRTYVQSLK